MNVHRRSNETNEHIEAIKNEMYNCSFAKHSNDDMTIDVKGYLHNQRGFILKVQNMEKLDDTILRAWQDIVERKGYHCNMSYDFQDGWVDVKCSKESSKACLKAAQLSIFGYLSMIIVCIYLLWYRQNKMLPK